MTRDPIAHLVGLSAHMDDKGVLVMLRDIPTHDPRYAPFFPYDRDPLDVCKERQWARIRFQEDLERVLYAFYFFATNMAASAVGQGSSVELVQTGEKHYFVVGVLVSGVKRSIAVCSVERPPDNVIFEDGVARRFESKDWGNVKLLKEVFTITGYGRPPTLPSDDPNAEDPALLPATPHEDLHEQP